MFSQDDHSTETEGGCRPHRHGAAHHVRHFAYGPRGEFGGPFGGFGHRGGPRGRGRKARRGDIRTAALLLLAEEPRNGYQIMQEVQERSAAGVAPEPGLGLPGAAAARGRGPDPLAGDRRAQAVRHHRRRPKFVDERGSERPAPWDEMGEEYSGNAHELGRLMREVAFAFTQVIRTGSEAQISSAGEVLSSTRRDLYRILADGDVEGDTVEK